MNKKLKKSADNKPKVESFLWNLLLLVLSSFLFLLSQPNFIIEQGLGILGFIQLVPVFFVLKKSSKKIAWLYGFFYGALSYGLFCYWLASFNPYTIYLGLPAFGVILALVFESMCWAKSFSKKYEYYMMGLVWLVYEYLKTKGFLGFPYGIVGYSQWRNVLFLQSASFAGVWWLSFVCVFCSALLADFFDALFVNRKNQPQKFSGKIFVFLKSFFQAKSIPCLAFAFSIVFTVAYGCFSLNRKSFGDRDFKVVAVQNNTDSNKYGLEVYKRDVANLMSLTDAALEKNQDASFVLWPETAVVPPIMYHYEKKSDRERLGLIESLLDFFETHDQCFVLGNQMSVDNGKKYLDDYNSALVFDVRSDNVRPPNPESYYKIHLVPFTETFPYEKIFPRLYKILLMGDSHLWTAGTDFKVFDQRGLKFSTPICFEDCFGELCRNFVKNGAQCFFNLTNDSWSQSSACQMQHLSMAVFRSVENSVPTVRSTGSGATCFVDRNGRIYGQTDFFRQNCSVQSISVSENQITTFYSRFGDWLPVLETAVAIVLMIFKLVSKIWLKNKGKIG